MTGRAGGNPAARRQGFPIARFIAAAALATVVCVPSAAAGEEPEEPVLVGPAGPDRIPGASADRKSVRDAYIFDDAAVRKVREAAGVAGGDLSIEVIFGSWRSDSRDQVPRFIKILEQVGKDGIPVTYLGVPKSREERGEHVAVLKITAKPTFIVSRKGSEIGRIVETPQASIEEDLAEILARPEAP